ncbi:DUF2970 domain-containing protein [Spiribacter aquaticus]|jgi:hypothetical protein|uniref:DUF2970 domain-containing protein n=2 Tax=Spiribacter TaxID=1335745 RepID=A0A557RKB4_9GAMM|nr:MULTISPECIES: DUF2970 domain-containing protein [Spiribacter]PYZ99919.1 DUF2970 domain-containing protein [Gammaproteobacteria bacterium 2W06]AUB77961.1 hypothetical protein BBH56_01740 [Spiribacter roseus]KAF0279920.1 hypothetical protein BA897_04060 [Spiribacter roseus]KAF0282267.1 hypothetical protein BA900_01420 [Spiribacter roseus]TVO65556.1 DUF2970 domain-containing protein [Spiribacter aquaticus]
MTDPQPSGDRPARVSLWQALKSTAAAAFGVQTEAARQRDFSHGNPAHFIIAGLIFTVVFVVVLLVIVNLVLSQAG